MAATLSIKASSKRRLQRFQRLERRQPCSARSASHRAPTPTPTPTAIPWRLNLRHPQDPWEALQCFDGCHAARQLLLARLEATPAVEPPDRWRRGDLYD